MFKARSIPTRDSNSPTSWIRPSSFRRFRKSCSNWKPVSHRAAIIWIRNNQSIPVCKRVASARQTKKNSMIDKNNFWDIVVIFDLFWIIFIRKITSFCLLSCLDSVSQPHGVKRGCFCPDPFIHLWFCRNPSCIHVSTCFTSPELNKMISFIKGFEVPIQEFSLPEPNLRHRGKTSKKFKKRLHHKWEIRKIY